MGWQAVGAIRKLSRDTPDKDKACTHSTAVSVATVVVGHGVSTTVPVNQIIQLGRREV